LLTDCVEEADEMNINTKIVRLVLTKDMNMMKVCVKMIPKISVANKNETERIVLLDFIHRLVSQKIEELKI
jgi:hypothetical protein